MIYELCKYQISSGMYDKEKMLKDLKLFLAAQEIDEEEYKELCELMDK